MPCRATSNSRQRMLLCAERENAWCLRDACSVSVWDLAICLRFAYGWLPRYHSRHPPQLQHAVDLWRERQRLLLIAFLLQAPLSAVVRGLNSLGLGLLRSLEANSPVQR
jgi:hypothetical protein